MRRRFLTFALLVLAFALPSAGAAANTDAPDPLSPLGLWSDLVEWVTGLGVEASTHEAEPEAPTWTVAVPDGTQTTEPTLPEGELGPIADPNG